MERPSTAAAEFWAPARVRAASFCAYAIVSARSFSAFAIVVATESRIPVLAELVEEAVHPQACASASRRQASVGREPYGKAPTAGEQGS
mmetsp:Transcript_16742/g.44934  ORF Transcript_16742/g.44934 Transcript_16742/m.44934 type:complete len:89 (+) Transcript_16742:300-566(+)